MKKTIVIIIFILPILLFGQNKVILHSNGVATSFGGGQPFIDAYDASVDGDTIYLPGGQLAYPINIDKSIKIFGAGHHPDFTPVTGQTIIPSNVNIRENASKLHLEGIYFNGSISFNTSAKIDSVTIKRCLINGNLTLNGIDGNESDGIIIVENIIKGSLNGQNTKNLVLNNNIFKLYSNNVLINLSNNAWVANNVIMGRGYVASTVRYILNNINDSYFENNVIYNLAETPSQYFSSSVINNTFMNNVFGANEVTSTENNWINNYWETNAPDILLNIVGITFEYEEDYNLINPSAFQGTSLNQVGIYGGVNPAKLGAIPVNPHFLIKNIAPQTNTLGELSIEIEIDAQNE